ncbi:uncharacterized protein [Aristolochia californica]|uniref:uncharacterized protein isoform X2 n=1 Tax=Aristolochia californica TaxID=171875 RepID=UPI0035DD9E89
MKKTKDPRTEVPLNREIGGSVFAATAANYGVELAVDFKPVEHPAEPFSNDQPVTCPLPEPSILNDGRIWKERLSASTTRNRSDLQVMKESTAGVKLRPNRFLLPSSISAPEHNIRALLEECNVPID